MMYECVICWGNNNAVRTHCQFCGTIPAAYSLISKPSVVNRDLQFIEVAPAYGASHVENHRNRRLNFRTVAADSFV